MIFFFMTFERFSFLYLKGKTQVWFIMRVLFLIFRAQVSLWKSDKTQDDAFAHMISEDSPTLKATLWNVDEDSSKLYG